MLVRRERPRRQPILRFCPIGARRRRPPLRFLRRWREEAGPSLARPGGGGGVAGREKGRELREQSRRETIKAGCLWLDGLKCHCIRGIEQGGDSDERNELWWKS